MIYCIDLSAQVPYFASCPQKGLVSAYASLSYNTDDNTWESYAYSQYSISDYITAGIHLGSYDDVVIAGPELRGGYNFNNYFNFSLHLVPSFDLKDHFNFTDASLGLYMNGDILTRHRLFWLTNSYYTICRDRISTWWQYWYIGSSISLGGSHHLTPMVGCSHSLRFDENPDLDLGLVYTFGNWNFMVWSSDITSGHPFITTGIEFNFPTK